MYNTAKLNIFPKSFWRVLEEFPKSSSKEFPKSSHRVLPCSKKERPQTLYHVHYVCTRVVTTSGRGDSCPNLVYSATFVALLRHLFSGSGNLIEAWRRVLIYITLHQLEWDIRTRLSQGYRCSSHLKMEEIYSWLHSSAEDYGSRKWIKPKSEPLVCDNRQTGLGVTGRYRQAWATCRSGFHGTVEVPWLSR
jgi:hypothetical protein